MPLITDIVHNPVKVSVGVLLVGLFGLIAVFRMPMQLTPEVQTPTLTITTIWPGASPQEIEREIVQEQEEQLKGVEGLLKMSSESVSSSGTITLEFAVGTDMAESLLKVNTRLQQVSQYPEDTEEPVITTANASDRPIAWFILGPWVSLQAEIPKFLQSHPEMAQTLAPVLSAHSDRLALRRLRDLAEKHPPLRVLLPSQVEIPKLRRFAEDVIEARFERVPGVANANVLGGREDELQVVVDPQKLAARRLTIDELRAALRGQNRDTSAGDLWEGKRRYVVRTLGKFRSIEQVANAIITRRDGVAVYVRDVAEVRLDFKRVEGFVRHFGTFKIAINCQRATGANVLEVMNGLRQATAQLNATVLHPRGLHLDHVYDETDYIYSALGLVKNNIILGSLLTVAVLLLFLRSGRSTLIIGLAIPTSIIGTFLVLQLLGRSLNVISLAGLAFAVGMLVDNAIVVLENIYRHYQNGESPLIAAVQGTTEVGGAVLASTLTTLAIFLPVLFVQEEAGQLFRDIALAISASVGLSLIVSVTVITTAAAYVLREQAPQGLSPGQSVHRQSLLWRPLLALLLLVRGGFFRPLDWLGRSFVQGALAVNAWLCHGVLRRLILVVGLTSLSLWFSYRLLPSVEYLPTGNRNLVVGILLPPPGYHLEELERLGQQIELSLKPYWDVDPGSAEAAQLKYPILDDFFYVARGRNLFLGLRCLDSLRSGELVPLIRSVSRGMPGTICVAKQASIFEQGLSAGRTIDVEITGPDLSTLIELGKQISGQAAQLIPEAQVFPKPSLDLANPEIHVLPKWEQAADLGINAVSLGYAVNVLLDGAYTTDYYLNGKKIDLSLVGSPQLVQHTQDLASLPLATPSGDLIPLGAVAQVKLASGPEQIAHRERQRAITVQVSPPPRVALEDAMKLIQTQIVQPMWARGQLQGGLYQINLAGTADKLRQTWEALRFNILLATLITYLLLAALLESWLYPWIIIWTVPLGAVGGFLGLWVLNRFVFQSLDILTMLGFVILIGTVVNNPILIVYQSLLHLRQDQMSLEQAVLTSVRTRIRPIFMTTLSTVAGLAPLVISPGAGSELYRGLGSVLLGGLLISTMFTLVFIPSFFTLCLETGHALRKRFLGR